VLGYLHQAAQILLSIHLSLTLVPCNAICLHASMHF
jgi:hypothetical protein